MVSIHACGVLYAMLGDALIACRGPRLDTDGLHLFHAWLLHLGCPLPTGDRCLTTIVGFRSP